VRQKCNETTVMKFVSSDFLVI